MKPFLKRESFLLALITLAVLASLYAWPRVPETLPVHWGINGEPDRYGGRLEALFVLPVSVLATYLLFLVLPYFDKRNRDNEAVLRVVRDTVVLGLTALHLGLLATYLGAGVSVNRLVAVIVGTVLLGVGNWLPKLEPNAWAGFRVPWVFKSKRAWYAGQRWSGWLLSVCGVAMILVGFFTEAKGSLSLMVLLLLLGISGVTVYTFYLWRSDPHAERT